MVLTLNHAITQRALDILLGNYVGVPRPLCRKLWHVLQRRRSDGFASAILYCLRRPASTDVDVYACAHAAFAGPLEPRRFVPWLDVLAAAGDLTRQEATCIQEHILFRCNNQGQWKEW
jgi:hypothetical protein